MNLKSSYLFKHVCDGLASDQLCGGPCGGAHVCVCWTEARMWVSSTVLSTLFPEAVSLLSPELKTLLV